jgi:hypothetical protein
MNRLYKIKRKSEKKQCDIELIVVYEYMEGALGR